MTTNNNLYIHNICSGCWRHKFANRQPVKLKLKEFEVCCFCGLFNSDGIFTMNKPQGKCEGVHNYE